MRVLQVLGFGFLRHRGCTRSVYTGATTTTKRQMTTTKHHKNHKKYMKTHKNTRNPSPSYKTHKKQRKEKDTKKKMTFALTWRCRSKCASCASAPITDPFPSVLRSWLSTNRTLSSTSRPCASTCHAWLVARVSTGSLASYIRNTKVPT